MTLKAYDDGDGRVDVLYQCNRCKMELWSDTLPDGWKEIDEETHLCSFCVLVSKVPT